MAEVKHIPVSFTQSAITELKAIRDQDQVPADHYLRVGVKGGGCSGLSYVLDFDRKQDFDELYEIDGLAVIMDKRHSLYVAGMEVDYQSGLNDRGFIFNNPNASSTCGCGTSFAT
ncbi:MAG: iron-sulfur cluster assembly accessory protein [Bacteroidetes bacterium]|nr:MAG: iron-sulfur cluster assembly accessory protein [Bacteroidota bacterium]